ncbi:MAG: ferrous iron transport protein B [Spirochaetales bacterium]|jgi:ferrous iron transport protein B|nr:ferrous iron transport protein B [Spirochaetales bacterium]
MITAALAGNPNSGKTTLFNALTGANQRVGNWPGVTVDKKEGWVKKDRSLRIIDLPGIYSLSPYTLEEVISRDFLLDEKPDVVINLVDASNIERNLYLTTQILDMGIPTVIALNMMDVVRKAGDRIDTKKLSQSLGCPVVEISALKGEGLEDLLREAAAAAGQKKAPFERRFSAPVEQALEKIGALIAGAVPEERRRWYSIKFFEQDAKAAEKTGLAPEALGAIDKIIKEGEKALDDASASIITGESYDYITGITSACIKKSRKGLSASDKIDRVVTNKWLALPIFAAVMIFVYYISVTTIGAIVTDFTNDTLFGSWIMEPLAGWFEEIGTAGWLASLIVDGIIGGVGAVLGFVPQMLVLFLMLSLLEDVGYMARVAFIMDRIFRRFGLSGKTFIPLLISSGCGVPGVMASRTIESERDRRLTVMTTCFVPCGAKTPIVAMIAGAVFGGVWWVAPSAYFVGLGAVIISGLILKKTRPFAGKAAPFVMELPSYHVPAMGNVLRSMGERGWSFIKRAGTIILMASIVVWFFSSFGFVPAEDGGGTSFAMVEEMDESMLAVAGTKVAVIFRPLGFGFWQATVASIMGLVAKEEVVGVFGVLFGVEGDALGLVEDGDFGALSPIAAPFTMLTAYSFLVFNLLCAPCFAAMGAIRREMNSGKWTAFAISYMCVLAYAAALMFYQFGILIAGAGFSLGSVVAIAVLALIIWLLVKPAWTEKKAAAPLAAEAAR